MARMRLGLEQSLTLSIAHQRKLDDLWTERVQDPLAFVPFEERKHASVQEAHEQNCRHGEFAVGYLKGVLSENSSREDRLRRIQGQMKILAAGYGRKYDSDWLRYSIRAGLETWWVDISHLVCDWAKVDLWQQFQELKIPEELLSITPGFQIKHAELRSVIADPGSINLDLSTVEVWYLGRTLGCLSARSANIVLRGLGASLSSGVDKEGKNRIVIINAFRDYNPRIEGVTSNLLELSSVARVLGMAAHRPIEMRNEKTHLYWNKTVTAVTFAAK